MEIADVEEKSEENQNEERVDEQKEEQNEERSEEQASDVVVNYEFIGNNMVSSQNDLNQHNISNDDRILDMLLWRQVGEMQLRHRLTNILVLIMTIQIIAINIFLFWLGLGKITLNNLEPLRWLFTFVIAEVIGFVSIIVKYLFNSKENHALDLLQQYIRSYHPNSSQNNGQNDTNYNF